MEPPDQASYEGPPADPDDWTDEQWIEWLEQTDAAAEGQDVQRPVTALGRLAHSSPGSVLGQAMLGMATALYGREQSKIVIVAEGSSQPDTDKPFDVHLDHEHPERSVVVFRSQRPHRRAGESTADL
ncbi:MAG: hypothetical protein M0Z46_00785 [Actinomycetota bacterium]|nr:hypothetical protein [Actinomycetota bacterium]